MKMFMRREGNIALLIVNGEEAGRIVPNAQGTFDLTIHVRFKDPDGITSYQDTGTSRYVAVLAKIWLEECGWGKYVH